MTVPSGDIQALLAPLVIGVTGHRDLRPDDLDELKKKIRHILRSLKKQYPSTPIILLSPLAEGADRLAAVVALEEKARLVVPLPMAQDLYERDFESEESRVEFRELLASAEHRIQIPMQADEKELARGGTARDRQYEAMGKCIARESQILIALWDGTDSGKIGGTAEIVRFQLHGILGQSECDLQPPELFPVYRIVTPRRSNPSPKGKPFHLEKLYPETKGDQKNKKAEAYYDQIFHNLEDFNLQILKGGDALAAKALESKRQLLGDCDAASLSAGQSLDLERYAIADSLAQRFHKMQYVDWLLHAMVFVAFVCFITFAHLEGHHWRLLATSLVLLAIAFSLVKWYLPRAKLDSRSQDYRAIAEGSRVRFFWHLAGVRESVAENYLGKQRTELDWIRNGLRGWELETHMAPQAAPPPMKEHLEKVQELWIDGQIDYFGPATAGMEKKLERWERVKGLCAWFSVGTALGTLLALFILRYYHWENDIVQEYYLSRLIIAIDLGLILAALFHHYIQQKAYPQHIKQFSRMETVFGKAKELIDQKLKTGDLAGVQDCLRKVGQEALSENGDWVLLRRERPLELPPP
jgi:hypothetical protein